MKRQTEHAFTEIIRDIKNNKVKNSVLLYGEENFLIDWAKKQFIERYTSEAVRAFDLTIFDGNDFNVGELIESAETLPMFSEKKVTVLDNFPKVWSGFDTNNSDDKKLLDYINNISETSMLIITSDESKEKQRAKNKSSLIKALKENGSVYYFDTLSETDLIKFAKKRIKAAKKTISQNAMKLLIQSSGYNSKNIDYALYNFENDLKKIIALSEGEVITEKDVIDGISDNIEHNVFKLVDSMTTNKKSNAFLLLNEMLLSGGSEYQILGYMISQLELLLQVKELKNMGITEKGISKKLGVHEFRVRNAYKFATNFSEKDLRRILTDSFEADDRIKTGLLSASTALEMLIATV